MNSDRKTLLSGLLIMAGSLAHAQRVTLSPVSPHPQAAVAVSGAHFADAEAIDVYVDTVDTSLLVSTSTGTFSGAVTVPAEARADAHAPDWPRSSRAGLMPAIPPFSAAPPSPAVPRRTR